MDSSMRKLHSGCAGLPHVCDATNTFRELEETFSLAIARDISVNGLNTALVY